MKQTDEWQNPASASVEPACLALIPETLLPEPARRAVLLRARQLGTTVDEIILAENLVSEEVYYRLIAQTLGLCFASTALKVIEPKHAVEAWQLRMIRLDPSHHEKEWVTAPKGQALDYLLTQQLTSNEGVQTLVITTPRLLFESIMRSKGASAAQYFTHFLHDRNPGYSSYTLCHNAGKRMLPFVILCVLTISAVILGASISQIATLFLLPVLLIRLIVLATTPRRQNIVDPDVADRHLPHYTILVPLYHEGDLIPQLLQNLTRFDYPPARREVLFLIEEEDIETQKSLARHILPYGFHVIVLPRGQPRTKPRALNVGLAFSTGTLIVIYDAEDRPEPQQLRKAARHFTQSPAQTACLQASLVIDNLHQGLLPHLFALEYASLFDVTLPRLAHKQWPVALGGSSNHFRKLALTQAFGWDPWNVTEDADLGLRFARLGYGIEHLDSATYEDAPDTLRDWFMQRRRWIKGWIMTAAVHLQNPRRVIAEAGWINFFLLAYHSLGLVSAVLFWPLTLFDLPYVLARQTPAMMPCLIMLLPFLCSLPVIVWPLFQARQIRHHPLPLRVFVCLPFYFLCMTAAGWAGIWEYITTPHHWNKTPHKPHS